MQTLIKKSRSAADVKSFPGSDYSKQENNNEDGFIVVKEGEGVFYVRYDIIFAKAGDMFFMPRKVTREFNMDSDHAVVTKASAGDFDKFLKDNFQPFKGEPQISERVPTKDELQEFVSLTESL